MILLMFFVAYFGVGWFIYRKQVKHVVYGNYLPFNTMQPYLGSDFKEGYHLPMKKKLGIYSEPNGKMGIPISVVFIHSIFAWPITGIKMVLVHLMMKPIMTEEQKRLPPELEEEMEEVTEAVEEKHGHERIVEEFGDMLGILMCTMHRSGVTMGEVATAGKAKLDLRYEVEE